MLTIHVLKSSLITYVNLNLIYYRLRIVHIKLKTCYRAPSCDYNWGYILIIINCHGTIDLNALGSWIEMV